MKFNIYLATLLTLTCVTTLASDKGLRNLPPVEKIQPRKTTMPPPVPVPVTEDSGLERAQVTNRPDRRANQYVNLMQGAGSAPVIESKKTEITFCDYLATNEEKFMSMINSSIQSVQFNTSGPNSGRLSQFHLLGSTSYSRADGTVKAFVYESITGSIFILRFPNGSTSGRGEFVPHSIPSHISIIDKDAYRGDNFWNAVSQGNTPLCGRYINLVRN